MGGEAPPQPCDRGGQAAHVHDPAGGVVVFGEHPGAFVDVAEEPLLSIAQYKLEL